MAETEKKFYSVGEFAEAIGYSTDRVYEWVRTGRIQATKVTGTGNWLIPSSELERLERKGNIKKTLTYDVRLQKHFAELSATALKLAEILDWYYKYHRFTIEPFISSDFPYTAHQLELATLNEKELSNLVAHLKDEIPELIPIGEYPKACKQWFTLGNRKWEKETPAATITGDLILKLKLRANQGNFTGRCPDCPR